MATKHDAQPGTRFSIGTWLRQNFVDLITMALMGAAGLGLYFSRTYYPLPVPLFLTHSLLFSTRAQPLIRGAQHERRRCVSRIRGTYAQGDCDHLRRRPHRLLCSILFLLALPGSSPQHQ